MMIEVDLKVLARSGLTPNEYCILWCIANNESFEWLKLDLHEDYNEYLSIVNDLESKLFIKQLDNSIELREKAIRLNLNGEDNVSFEEFWNKYHEIVIEWNKTAKASAEVKWKRLSKKHRLLAVDNIQVWYDSLKVINGKRISCLARTYLDEKRFLDEFEPVNQANFDLNMDRA